MQCVRSNFHQKGQTKTHKEGKNFVNNIVTPRDELTQPRFAEGVVVH